MIEDVEHLRLIERHPSSTIRVDPIDSIPPQPSLFELLRRTEEPTIGRHVEESLGEAKPPLISGDSLGLID
jgi:hypothetical protein